MPHTPFGNEKTTFEHSLIWGLLTEMLIHWLSDWSCDYLNKSSQLKAMILGILYNKCIRKCMFVRVGSFVLFCFLFFFFFNQVDSFETLTQLTAAMFNFNVLRAPRSLNRKCYHVCHPSQSPWKLSQEMETS